MTQLWRSWVITWLPQVSFYGVFRIHKGRASLYGFHTRDRDWRRRCHGPYQNVFDTWLLMLFRQNTYESRRLLQRRIVAACWTGLYMSIDSQSPTKSIGKGSFTLVSCTLHQGNVLWIRELLLSRVPSSSLLFGWYYNCIHKKNKDKYISV